MKFKLTLLALLAGASMVAQAQAPAAPARADVKKETAAANKAGAIPDANKEGSTVAKPVKSDKSRADVKKETAAANKGGALDNKDGEKSGMVQAPTKSDKARADVKKETAAANKAGTIEKNPGQPKN